MGYIKNQPVITVLIVTVESIEWRWQKMDSSNDVHAINDVVQETLADAGLDYYTCLAHAYLARYPEIRRLYGQ